MIFRTGPRALAVCMTVALPSPGCTSPGSEAPTPAADDPPAPQSKPAPPTPESGPPGLPPSPDALNRCTSDADCTLAVECCACPQDPKAMSHAQQQADSARCQHPDCTMCSAVSPVQATGVACQGGRCVAVMPSATATDDARGDIPQPSATASPPPPSFPDASLQEVVRALSERDEVSREDMTAAFPGVEVKGEDDRLSVRVTKPRSELFATTYRSRFFSASVPSPGIAIHGVQFGERFQAIADIEGLVCTYFPEETDLVTCQAPDGWAFGVSMPDHRTRAPEGPLALAKALKIAGRMRITQLLWEREWESEDQ